MPQARRVPGLRRDDNRVNRAAEPSPERWMKRAAVGDALRMAHLMNLLCGTVLVYALFTRGGLAVARGIEFVVRKTS
jgi:hypothetical protein